jgi:hypothetical protein
MMQQDTWIGPAVNIGHGPLRVSANRRFLQHADGAPFFYLGDTAWELFHRLTREEIALYLEKRRSQGFTVIQAVALSELGGLTIPNAQGEFALADVDAVKPNEAYFQFVDWVIDEAADKGLCIGLLPTWGDKVQRWGGIGPDIFHPAYKGQGMDAAKAKAHDYGRWIGRRYRNRPNLIWIMGGDREPAGIDLHPEANDASYAPAIWRAMALGVREGDAGSHLMTYHTCGIGTSSLSFHNDDWLDFNFIQSAHFRRDEPNYDLVAADYARTPTKPVMDGEPRYEDHAVNWNLSNHFFDAFDVRQAAYWALFAGAFGHTYGAHPVWQFWQPGRAPISYLRRSWQDALDLEGAADMIHARRLIESHDFFSRVPDQSLIASENPAGAFHIQATRGNGYALLYIPCGSTVEVRMDRITAESSDKPIHAFWFNPRTGERAGIGQFAQHGTQAFTPSDEGRPLRLHDWVLELREKGQQTE